MVIIAADYRWVAEGERARRLPAPRHRLCCCGGPVRTGLGSRLERPQEKDGFVKTVYASGSHRLFENKAEVAGETRTGLLLALWAAGLLASR